MQSNGVMPKPKTNEKTPPNKEARPPAQSQIDQERGDWEGMGQARYQPDEDIAKPAAEKPAPKKR